MEDGMGRGAGSSQRQELHVPCMVKLRPGQEEVLREVRSSVKSQESGRESQESRVEDLPGWGVAWGGGVGPATSRNC